MSKEIRKRRRFTPEFKAEAVRPVLEQGKSIHSTAKALDLVPSVLAVWVRQAKADKGQLAGVATSDEKQELARLRKEVRELKMERDILKKAAAFFAKETL